MPRLPLPSQTQAFFRCKKIDPKKYFFLFLYTLHLQEINKQEAQIKKQLEEELEAANEGKKKKPKPKAPKKKKKKKKNQEEEENKAPPLTSLSYKFVKVDMATLAIMVLASVEEGHPNSIKFWLCNVTEGSIKMMGDLIQTRSKQKTKKLKTRNLY